MKDKFQKWSTALYYLVEETTFTEDQADYIAIAISGMNASSDDKISAIYKLIELNKK